MPGTVLGIQDIAVNKTDQNDINQPTKNLH